MVDRAFFGTGFAVLSEMCLFFEGLFLLVQAFYVSTAILFVGFSKYDVNIFTNKHFKPLPNTFNRCTSVNW